MIKFPILLSPKIYNLIEKDKVSCIPTINELVNAIERFKGTVVLVLPERLRWAMKKSSELYSLHQYLFSSSQRSVIIEYYEISCTPYITIDDEFEVSKSFNDVFIGCLRKYVIPLIALEKECHLRKEQCTAIENNCRDTITTSLACNSEIDCNFPRFDSIRIDSLFTQMKEANIKSSLFEYKHIDESGFKDVIKFIARLRDIDINESELDNYKCCNEFYEDLNADTPSRYGILFSIARMIAFPPAGHFRERTQGSIDHHHTPRTLTILNCTYDLWRLDVIDNYFDHGYRDGSSGSKRIIYAKKGGSTILIVYTSKHYDHK